MIVIQLKYRKGNEIMAYTSCVNVAIKEIDYNKIKSDSFFG